MKIIPTTELIAPRLVEFATACGETLARAHARTGDPVAIEGYIGKGAKFAAAIGRFARSYADQNVQGPRAARQRHRGRRRGEPAGLIGPLSAKGPCGHRRGTGDRALRSPASKKRRASTRAVTIRQQTKRDSR